MKHNWGCLVFFIPLTVLAQIPAAYLLSVNALTPPALDDSGGNMDNFLALFLTTIFDVPLALLWIAYFLWAKQQGDEAKRR